MAVEMAGGDGHALMAQEGGGVHSAIIYPSDVLDVSTNGRMKLFGLTGGSRE